MDQKKKNHKVIFFFFLPKVCTRLSRRRIVDEKTGQVFYFTVKGGNVHHEMLLPAYVDPSFKKTSELMNAIEIKCN